MRKVALALAAAALLLFAGSLAWKADATVVGTPDFARAAKAYSPVNQIACKYDAFCKPGCARIVAARNYRAKKKKAAKKKKR